MRKVIILQARLASSRFPSKVLAELSGRPAIAHIIDRLKLSKLADEVCVAIPDDPGEDKLAAVLGELAVSITRGSMAVRAKRASEAVWNPGAMAPPPVIRSA